MKFIYVKRIKKGTDYGTVEIPESNLTETMQRNPEWYVVGAVDPDSEPQREFIQPAKDECPICGKEFKNANGLRLHKRVHQ